MKIKVSKKSLFVMLIIFITIVVIASLTFFGTKVLFLFNKNIVKAQIIEYSKVCGSSMKDLESRVKTILSTELNLEFITGYLQILEDAEASFDLCDKKVNEILANPILADEYYAEIKSNAKALSEETVKLESAVSPIISTFDYTKKMYLAIDPVREFNETKGKFENIQEEEAFLPVLEKVNSDLQAISAPESLKAVHSEISKVYIDVFNFLKEDVSLYKRVEEVNENPYGFSYSQLIALQGELDAHSAEKIESSMSEAEIQLAVMQSVDFNGFMNTLNQAVANENVLFQFANSK